MSWSDEELDKLFKDSADKLSFEFKPEFLDEFEALQESADLGAVGASDEVDMLYQRSASELNFEYKDAYWQEMQNFLPRRRQPDFLWWGTAALFMAAFITNISFQNFSEDNVEPKLVADSQNAMVGSNHSSTIQNEKKNSILVEEKNTIDGNLTSSSAQRSIDAMKINQTQIFTGSNKIGVSHSRGVDKNNNSLIPLVQNDQNVLVQEEANKDNLTPSINDNVDALSTIQLTNDVNKELNVIEQVIPQLDLKMPSAMSYFVELNGGLSQSLTTPSDRISTNVGLGIGFQLNKGKFSLLTSVYGQIADHNDIVLNREAKVYGFGSQVYRYTMKYNQIYSVEANVSMGYRLGRHQIFAGVRPSYVVGTKVGVTMMEEEVQTDRQTVYGHYVGISRFGLKPTIGYAYELPRNLTVGLNIGIQTMKSVNEQYIDGVNRTLPIDGQLFLRKTINFRKK